MGVREINDLLNDTEFHLKEARKAILGRGGEISVTAGIKDIHEAVWSIPADKSLAFRYDTSTAYKKSVPSGALTYTRIKKIGCMSYMPHKNLLSYPYVDTTKFYNGVQYTDNGDGTITTRGSVPPYTESYFILTKNLSLQDGKTYYFSKNIALRYTDDAGTMRVEQYNHRITWKSSYTFIDLCIYFDADDYYLSANKTITPSCTETPLGDNLLTKPVNVGIFSIDSLDNQYNIMDTKKFPKEIQSLKGWGLGINNEFYNYLEWRNNKIFYVRMVDECDLGDFIWRFFTSTQYFVTYPERSPEAWENIDLAECNGNSLGAGLCANYEMQPAYTISQTGSPDKTIGYVNPNSTYGRMIYIRNDAFTSKTAYLNQQELSNSLKGEKFIYPLKTPVEEDVTHLFADTSPFIKTPKLQFIFNNDEKLPIPSTIKYTIKVG